MLNADELQRYDRQIMLSEIGASGQERLKESRILVAGAGGLGSPICVYLAAAGVGFIRVVDHDTVDLSNLNRQVLHWTGDVGEMKVVSAGEKLGALNPHITLDLMGKTIDESNVNQLVKDVDLIVDAMDNLATRYLLNKTAIDRGIPFFHGAVYGFEGRAMTVIPGKGACLRCMYRGDVPAEKFPVVGVAPGVIGCIQATEVIKYVLGIGDLLINTLLVYDGMSLEFNKFTVQRYPECDHCGEG
jgi:adenylyltransferase/sulfurtransferase